MKRSLSLDGSVAALAIGALLVWATSGTAYESYEMFGPNASCADCHAGFIDAGALHNVHVGGNQMTTNCQLCHINTGDIPRTYTSGEADGQGCRGCHGVDNGTAFGWGAGLRAHHANAGAPPDMNGEYCDDCHDDPSPSPESTIPVYYLRADVDVKDPCSSTTADGEDWDGDSQGLDNDGDLVYDEADSDCLDVGVDEGTGMPVSSLALLSISPNPVRAGRTEVLYALPEKADVVIGVYDTVGRLVAREEYASQSPGRHAFSFEGRDRSGDQLASGVYLVRVEAARSLVFGQIVLVR